MTTGWGKVEPRDPSLKGEGEGLFQKGGNALKLFTGGFLGCGVPFWPE